MLRSIKELSGYPLQARDGQIGQVKACLFDDRQWRLRYIVADTGSWLATNQVLISPLHVGEPDTGTHDKTLPVDLTKERIEKSPPIQQDAPISRKYEAEFAKYYEQGLYWLGPYGWSPIPGPTFSRDEGEDKLSEAQIRRARRFEDIENSHLRSSKEIIGYAIQTSDDEFGFIDDFIFETGNWMLRFLVVSSKKWFPGKKFLIDIDWVSQFDWRKQTAHIGLSKAQLNTAPEYDPQEAVNQDYLQDLYNYYGEPCPEAEPERAHR